MSPGERNGSTSPGSAQALAELQRLTDAALAHLSVEALLTELLNRIVDILGTDTAAILLLERDGRMLLARAAKGIEEEVEQGVRIPVGQGFAGRVAAERRPIFIPDVDHADILNPILRQKGIRSLLGVPLLVEGRVLGVLHVGSLTPREFTSEDGELLQVAADRAALAIDHAVLFEQERSAREEAEAALRVLRAVQRVTDAALSALSLEDLLGELLDRITEILRTDTAAILLVEEDADVLLARAAKGIEEEVEQGVRIPLGKGFAGRIAQERRAIFIADVDHADVLNPILRQKGIRSLLGVPMLVEDRVLGVLHVGSLTPREFTDQETDLLQVAADRAAMAIEHAQAVEQRRLAETLQRTLLPQELIHVPGFEVAARYLPAAQATRLGGDWYDVFPLTGGRVGMVVGDVVGRGVAAAALMAQLRTAVRAYALDGNSPAEVVERVNRLLIYLEPATMTTAVFLVLDPEAETLKAAVAGHPPPLVVLPGGETRYLELETDVALGVSAASRYREQTCDLPTGSTLVLFTDGVVEVRGEPLDAGLERLRVLVESGPDAVEDVCDLVIGQLTSDGRPADDVALLAARVSLLEDRLVTSWPAEADALSDLRHLLRRWLRHHGATDAETYDITVAAQEASANAVEHAYSPGERAFDVEAVQRGGVIEVTVRDHGRWRAPRGRHRGRGLPMMEALVDSVEVQRRPEGTVVVLRRELAAAGEHA